MASVRRIKLSARVANPALVDRWICSVCLALFLVLVSGCATVHYRASTLPPELQAPPVENPQVVDLSRLAMTPPSSQLIDRGDVLEVTITAGLGKDDTFTFPVRVNDNGEADLPFVGSVALAGLELEAAEAAIAAACIRQQLYRDPHVTVTMKQQRVNRVTVVGAVKKPGIYSLPRGSSDLLAALVAAGGLADDAGTDVEIRQPNRADPVPNPVADAGRSGVVQAGYSATQATHSGAQTLRVNLVSAAKAGSGGYYVQDGAVVMVERRDPQPIHVMGLVKNPGRYEFPVAEELRMLDAIALAGGVKSTVANKVFIIRRMTPTSEPVLIQASIRKAKRDGSENLRLMPGDVVSVEQTPATILLDAINVIRFAIGASVTSTAL
ncbi:MAG: hypothetical protein GXP27_01475 [Planctomycetes bacterium]|nr:hypothetical protein [Planctomycetota bacterium]